MSVTIKVGCKADHANVALFENSLFPLFQEMLVADVQGKSNNDTVKPALATSFVRRPPVYNDHIYMFPLTICSHRNLY